MIDLKHRLELLQEASSQRQYGYRGARVYFHKVTSPRVRVGDFIPDRVSYETITCERVGIDEWECSDIPETLFVKPLDN